jgi:hypothetical protein
MIDTRTTRIGRARVCGTADPLTARSRLESLLGRADLRPSGLPPAAVLCVRRMLDPMPGKLQLETPEARPPPEWERAFTAGLERALRSAARPALEPVPASAEAVLFADHAELLACLARDVRDGTAWLHWWWLDLQFTSTAGEDAAAAAWLETPEHVPAALELLAARREAVRFVAGLTERDAVALTMRVIEGHRLPKLRRVVAAAPPASVAVAGPVNTGLPPSIEPPWGRVVPESAERSLPGAAELFLGVTLVLRRAPQLARAPSFAAAVRCWLQAPPVRHEINARRPPRPAGEAEEAPPGRRPPAAADAPPQREQEPLPPEPPPRGREQLLPIKPAVGRTDGAALRWASTPPMPSPHATPQDAQSRVNPALGDPPAATSESRTATRTPARRATPPAWRRARPRHTDRGTRMLATQASLPPLPQPSPEPPELVVETALGGVFYLLNLALFLGLYPDFTRPLDRGLALDPFDLLRLLGPRLLDEPASNDPLWRLLERLAGPRRFRPPRVWRVPPDWLAPFDHEGTWRWSAAQGTLRIVHPAGFPVIAVPRREEPAFAQLTRELHGHALPLRRTTLPREPAHPLGRWASRLAAYADARLRRALGLDSDASLEASLLRQHARVFVTATHVDVAFRLDELPLEVRYAGLDRTPGWIPAAGRFVALHFE